MNESFSLDQSSEKQQSLKQRVLEIISKVIAAPLNRVNGQELTTGDYYRYGLIGGLDRTQISPNRLVTIRTGIVLAGGTLLILKPDLAEELKALLGDSLTAESVSGLTVASIKLSVLGALFADRLDGDLARMTNQCSTNGETLDASADKICVHIPTAMAIAYAYFLQNPDAEVRQLLTYLAGGAAIGATADSIGSAYRGATAHKSAALDFWKNPLTNEERDDNLYVKGKNGADIIGKVKTSVAMLTTAGLILPNEAQALLNLSEREFLSYLTVSLLGASTLALASAGKKAIKARQA